MEIDTEGLRAFYLLHRKEVEDLFADSQLDNLRLLKQFLWDFEKFWAVLTDECAFRRLQPSIPIETSHLFRTKPAGHSDDPSRVTMRVASG